MCSFWSVGLVWIKEWVVLQPTQGKEKTENCLLSDFAVGCVPIAAWEHGAELPPCCHNLCQLGWEAAKLTCLLALEQGKGVHQQAWERRSCEMKDIKKRWVWSSSLVSPFMPSLSPATSIPVQWDTPDLCTLHQLGHETPGIYLRGVTGGSESQLFWIVLFPKVILS